MSRARLITATISPTMLRRIRRIAERVELETAGKDHPIPMRRNAEAWQVIRWCDDQLDTRGTAAEGE